MSNRMTEAEAEAMYGRFKLLIAIIVIVPAVLLAAFVEFRFRSIEQSNPFRTPGQRDEARVEVDQLPWQPAEGQRLYVPAYSQVYHQEGKPYLLTVTLNIRNTDVDHEIVVTSVRYFDTGGREIRSLLAKPVRLAALAATEFVIEKDDQDGGSGACFIVEWMAGQAVTPPIVETVNVDTSGGQGISFVVPAVVLSKDVSDLQPIAEQ